MKKIKDLKINFNLLIPVIILAFFSLLTLKNVTPLLGSDVSYINFFKKQLIGFILGAIGIVIIYNINIKKFKKFFNIIYFVIIFMLFILAFHPPILSELFIKHVNGANGWFKIINNKISFQPVEFFKIFLVLKLALISEEHLKSFTKDDWLIKQYFIYGALPILLVLKEPDLGGTALLGFAMLIMFLFSLKSKKYFRISLYFLSGIFFSILLLIFSPAFSNLIIKITPLEPYQLSRIDSWLQPFSTDGGYQLSQSLIFMGSAGPSGYGSGYNQISFPEAQTDLIFTVFTGFYGWVLGLFLILLYAFLIYNILSLALYQKDNYFKFIIIGFGSVFFLQVVENIGMLVGVFPITGIVLPFMSYGLSALITYSIIIGILLNISKETDFNPDKYNKK